MSTPPTGPPPGFYPDDQGTQRYWDGHAWTEQTQETTAPVEDPAPTQPFTVTPPVKAPKKKHTVRNVVLSALGVVVVLGIIGSIFGGDDTAPTATKASPTAAAAAPKPTTDKLAESEASYSSAVAAAEALADQQDAEPKSDDFSVKVKTLSKQCFGSAGCNVEARLVISAETPASDGVATEVTVKVTGDESGALVETVEVDEDGKYDAPELSLSTRSSGTKVKARITAVEVV